MALPGTPGQRISDLCNGNHITQKELAEKIGVSASQLSRIVSGETRTVSSDILIGVAKEFKVSTDYILGLSTVSVRKSYDISELGLSEGAVRGLVTGAVDVQILNRLLEHRNFPKLIDLIRIYFQDTAAKGITARNQLIEMATASLSDLMKEHPEHRAEAKQDLQLLNAQKIGEHEAEIEKLQMQLDRAEADIVTLKERIQEKDSLINELTLQNKQLKEDINRLLEKLDEMGTPKNLFQRILNI